MKPHDTRVQGASSAEKNRDGFQAGNQRFLTTKEAAKRYRLSPRFFHSRQQEGFQIPGVLKIGNRIRIDTLLFEEYITRLEDKPW